MHFAGIWLLARAGRAVAATTGLMVLLALLPEPAQSAATHVVPKQTCEGAGWQGTVGVIHSHPTGERCWYFFPSTQVATSDGQSFAQQPYPVDAIMCGTKVVWVARDLVQREVPLNQEQAVPAPQHRRGNRVHDGAASPKGEEPRPTGRRHLGRGTRYHSG